MNCMRNAIKPGMLRLLFKKYAKEVGIPKRLAHPHVLKHSAAHFALKASNNDLVAVQRFLGHKTLSSTGMYLKMGDAEACAKVQKNYFKG
jgi:site-specific recombinase XerC